MERKKITIVDVNQNTKIHKTDFSSLVLSYLILYGDKVTYSFFLFGAILHIYPGSRALMVSLTAIVLFILMFLAFLPEVLHKNIRLMTGAFGIAIFTLMIEIIGHETGIVFGEYEYGKILGLAVFGVPILIGLLWSAIIIASTTVTTRIISNAWISSCLAGLCAVGFDCILEPVAIKLGYWDWEGVGVPFQNYLAWFVITFISSIVLRRLDVEPKSLQFEKFFISLTLFMAALFLFI